MRHLPALALLCAVPPALATPLAPFLVRPSAALVRAHAGLPMHRDVPVVSDSVEDVRAFVVGELDRQWKQVDVDAQVELMARHGFLPRGVDLKDTYTRLFSTQAAAFYDTRTGVFHAIRRGGPTEVLGEFVVVAHELTHAAQDQAVPIQPRMDATADNDDRQRALQWVLEGQATLVGNRVGHVLGPPVPWPLGPILGELETMVMWTPPWRELAPKVMASTGADDVPPFLLEQLWTPYAEGSRFAWTLERILGKRAHRHMLCRAPASTEQLLHVEKYLARTDTPLRVEIPADGQNARASLTQGEWALRWLLRRHLDERTADDAAAGWGGDTMVLRADGASAWRIVMDTGQDAAELHRALSAIPWSTGLRIARYGDEVHVLGGPLSEEDARDVHARLLRAGRTRLSPGALDGTGGVCTP